MRVSLRVGDVTFQSLEFRTVSSDRVHGLETQRAEMRIQRVKWVPVVVNLGDGIYEFMGNFLR